MLKRIMFFIMCTMLLVFAGCNQKGDKTKTNGQVLSKSIEYDVSINNYIWLGKHTLNGANTEWYLNNLEGSVRSGFMELLWKNAMAGKLDLYDMNDKKIDTTELKKILTITDTVSVSIRNNIKNTLINRAIQFDEITSLRFREEWTYDPATMAVSKKVLALAPIMMPVKYDVEGNESYGKDKALFWVKFSKEPSNTKVLTKRIITNTTYSDFSLNNIKNADTTEIKKYTDLLCHKVFNDSIEAYDVASGPLVTVGISGKDLSSLLNKVDTIKSNGKETVVKTIQKFTTLRFLEEWSFDPNTMAIQKTVVGLCPVVACYEADGITFRGYMPCFWVYFRDLWAPFDGKVELIKKKK
jgi:hypothetical protein